MKKLEMWTERCKCGVILHQMNAPCFQCRKSDPERLNPEGNFEMFNDSVVKTKLKITCDSLNSAET